MPNIVILDGHVLNPGDISWKPLLELGELTVYDRTERSEVIARSKNADYLLVNKVLLDREILEHLPQLKCICLLATGYNNIDIIAARAQGVDVCNAGEYGTQSVAQHVFALLLHHTNQVALHDESVCQGEWSKSIDWSYIKMPLTELVGLTLGVFGYGSIGQKVAQIGLAMGMNVIAIRHNQTEQIDGHVKFVSTEEIFSQSDVLTLHVPLTEVTKNMINRSTLLKMKKSAILINTARGGLINEEDLTWALKEELIEGAYLDVLSQEPPKEGNPLIGLDNCIITPHIAWASTSSRRRLLGIVADNVKSHLSKNPQNLVN